MKKHFLYLTFCLFAAAVGRAQSLTTVTGLRLYEHHSKSIAGSMGANGFQSGYDFVKRAYVNSFNKTTFGPYTDGTDSTIDMVEHNGTYGNQGNFGFTSGVSSIWNGDIQGNGTTKWMEAPAGFNYATTTKVTQLKAAYNASTATQAITAVKNNTTYIGRIRNSELYVAVRTTNVTNGPAGPADMFFDFEYKYGTWTTGVTDAENTIELSVYPNPATGQVVLGNTTQQAVTAQLVSLTGQQLDIMQLAAGEVKTMSLRDAAKGMYLVVCTAADGSRQVQRLSVQ